MVDRSQQEGQYQCVEDRGGIPDGADIDAIDVDGADAGLLDSLAFLAELARVEHADAVASPRAFRHQLIHVTERLDGRIILFLNVGRAELACVGRNRCRKAQTERKSGRPGGKSAKNLKL